MKQKIKVEIKSAVSEQWPILRGASESFPDEWEYYVMRGSMHCLYKNEGGGYPDKLCGEIPCEILDHKQRLFFKDFASAIAWLNNPQPVKQEPEAIPFDNLDMGCLFERDGFIHIVSEPNRNNKSTNFGWAVRIGAGTSSLVYGTTLVNPIYGQITINVGRDAE